MRLFYKKIIVRNKPFFLYASKKNTGILNSKRYFFLKSLLEKKVKTITRVTDAETSNSLLFLHKPKLLKKLKNLLTLKKETAASKKKSINMPYFTPHYRAKARLQNKKNRRGLTKREQQARGAIKFRHFQTALKIQNARKKINARLKNHVRPFKSLAVITRVEKKNKRILVVKRKRKKGVRTKNKPLGYPPAIGVTRRRFAFSSVVGPLKSKLYYQTARTFRKNPVDKSSNIFTKQFKKFRLKANVMTFASEKNKNITSKPSKKNILVIAKIRRNKTKLTIRRPRTPGAGRIKNTFESALRKQYTVYSSKYYAQKNKNISRISFAIKNNQLPQSVASEAAKPVYFDNVQLLGSATQTYRPAGARLLLIDNCSFNKTGKFGFLKSATKIFKRALLFKTNQKNQQFNIGINSINESALQAALYQRRSIRQARDLRKAARKNKITKIKALPF